MLLLALLAPWAANAQTLTVFDGGTANSQYIPFEGYNADNSGGQQNQMIYPATELSAMNGKAITQMVFYIYSGGSNGSYTDASRLGTWTVSLGETEETTLSGRDNTTTLTSVYTGYMDCSSGTLTIEFENGYVYQGGNLLVQFYKASGSNSGQWNKWFFLGETTTGNTAYGSYNSTHLWSFLPQITFTYETPAATPKPSGLAVNGVTHNEATLSWIENGSATSWQYCLNGDEDHPVTINTNPYTLTGLTPLTSYTVKVRSINGNEYSAWCSEQSFSTSAVATVVGDSWIDDFEGASLGWELINGTQTNKWAWGTAANNGGANGLYVSNDNGTSNAYSNGSSTIVFATKLLNFTDGKYEFSYDWNANGEGGYDYLRVALVPASTTLTAGTTPSGFSTTGLPTGWIALDGGSKLNVVTAWQNKSLAVNVAAGNYYLVMAWKNDNSGGSQPPAAVDNVSITKVACDYDVEGLAVSNITTTTADIAWTNSEAGSWQVAVKAGAGEWEILPSTYNSNGATLTLVPSTSYQVRVRAYCDADHQGSWCNPISFATECDVISAVGYSENFDSYTTGNNVLPICWSYINTTTTTYYQAYPKIYNYSANSPSNCLYFYSYYSSSNDPQPQYAILPEMSDLAGKQITLQARGYNAASTFMVGTMSDPTNASTFTEITGSIDNPAAMTTSYQEYIFYIPSNTTDRYVAIMIEAASSSRSNNGVYIDDIEFSVAPTCWQPQNLTASDVTNESATLTWNRHAMGDETAWVLQYSTDNTFATATTVNVNTNPTYTIENGLAATTTYYVRVKPACDNDGNLWSETINFTTKASCMVPDELAISDITAHTATLNWTGNNDSYTLQYRKAITAPVDVNETYDFENNSLQGWTTLSNDGDSYAWSIQSGSSSSHQGNYCVKSRYTGSGVGAPNDWLISPEITLGGTFSFYAKRYGTTYTDQFQVYVSTTGNNVSDFTAISEVITPNTTYDLYEYDLSAYSGNGYVAIVYTGLENQYYVYIDDINYTNTIPGVYGEWVTVNNADKPYSFSNLDADSYYEAQVNGHCNSGDITTDWSEAITFPTTIACPAPTNLAYANVTAHTADLTWNVNGSVATSWVLTVNGGDIEINSSAVTITNGVASYALTGLNGETEYTVSVTANCGDLDGYSQPSNEESFTTEISCFAPTALTVTDSTTTTMTMSWTNGSEGQNAWVIDYKMNGEENFHEVDVTTNPYTLTGLTDGKTYTLKIRANCGEIDGLSQWSSEITHATEASCQTPTDITVSDVDGHGATISWTDPTVAGKSYIVMVASENMALNVDFENNSIPSNFTNDADYPWQVVANTHSGAYCVRSGGYNINSSESELTVDVTLTNDATLTFSAKISSEEGWDKGYFYIDETVQTDLNGISGNGNWINYSYNLSAGPHTLKWKYTKDTYSLENDDCLYVDDIKITTGVSEFVEKDPTTEHSLVIDDLGPETTYYVKVKGDCGSATSPESGVETFTTPAACNVPTNLTHDDESVTAHAATLSWTENNGATAWQVVYSKANLNDSEVTVDIDENDDDVNIVDGTTITYTLTGLDGQTTYTVRVKSNCGGVHNDMSAESNSTNFITLPACYPVGDVITSDITAYSVTVHWTDANNAGAYVIKQGETVLTGETTPSVVIDVENHSAVISGLEPEHTYTNGTFKVFADCGSEGMSATGTNVPYFQTEPSCYPVTNVTITGKTATSVTFTWEDTHNPEAYVIKEGENVLTGETAHSVVIDAENHTATISGLDENETYAAGTFKVFADCGTTDGQSAGVNVPAFTTPCSAHTTFPWTEDFNGLSVAYSIPDCWNNDEGTTSYASYKWCYTTATSGNGACNGTSHDGSKCVRFNSYNGSHINYLKSIPLSLPTDQTMQLKFWYKNPTGGDFSVYISTDGGATHETALATGLTGVSDWTEHDPINLSAYAGQEVVLVFKGTSNNGSGNAYIYLDDVTVEEAPACAAPSALDATAITNNSATLSWTANSGETAWTLYYKKTSEENYTEVTENVTNPYTLTVEASTEYIFYVVANCDESSESDPSATFTFTTQCDPIAVDADNPFTENFDASTFPPTDCWNTISNGTRNWTRNTYQNHNEGGSASAYSGYYGDVYLIMPTLAIANDDEAVVKLSFWSYNTYTGSYDKNSVVLLGNTETELWSPASVSQSWEETTIDLSAYKGQNITLAFKYEGNNAHGWYVDDLKVEFVYNYTKTVNGNSWYAISSPVNAPTATSVDNLIPTGTEKYDFFRYNETNATWENYKVHDFGFENGRGYIYRNSTGNDLTFTGTPNDGNDIIVNLTYTEAMDEHLRGFNLIGNPYTTEYALGRACYSLNTNGTWAAQTSSYLVQPFEAVMVQADEAGNYTFTNGSSKDAPKAVEALAIKVNGNGFEDVTYAMLENGKGLNKINHLAEEAPALSIAANGSDYAIAYLGYEVESFPLTLNAQAGTYTIALNSQISSLSYVHLIDNLTGKDIDLLSNAYTFTTDGNSANRFLVKLSPSSLQATEGEIATWNGNSWTVKGEGTLQLFDVMGRKVLSQEVSELSTINTDHLSSGVYVIRLGEKSQKIVVK